MASNLRATGMIASLALGVAAAACAHPRSDVPHVPTRAENVSGALERGLQHCPSAVPGARTRVQPIDRGVAIVVTAMTHEAEQEIRERAAYHEQLAVEPRMRHSGRGTGGGRTGYCPVIHPGAALRVEMIPGGARIVMQARDGGDIGRLRSAVLTRVRRLDEAEARLAERRRGRYSVR